MSVAKNIEITSTSTVGFEDAIKSGIERASRTINNIRGAWIKEQKISVSGGNVTEDVAASGVGERTARGTDDDDRRACDRTAAFGREDSSDNAASGLSARDAGHGEERKHGKKDPASHQLFLRVT